MSENSMKHFNYEVKSDKLLSPLSSFWLEFIELCRHHDPDFPKWLEHLSFKASPGKLVEWDVRAVKKETENEVLSCLLDLTRQNMVNKLFIRLNNETNEKVLVYFVDISEGRFLCSDGKKYTIDGKCSYNHQYEIVAVCKRYGGIQPVV